MKYRIAFVAEPMNDGVGIIAECDDASDAITQLTKAFHDNIDGDDISDHQQSYDELVDVCYKIGTGTFRGAAAIRVNYGAVVIVA